MAGKFKSILVPVDFSINTEVAVKKAIEFSGAETVIHLLNVQMDLFLGASPRTYQYLLDNAVQAGNRSAIDEQLQQWQWLIEECSEAKVRTSIVYDSSVSNAIERKAVNLKADIVIIGKNCHHAWMPFLNTVVPSYIAERTGIAVLTVKPGSLLSKTKKIVVPITDKMMDYKIRFIATFCNGFDVKIFLVTFMTKVKSSDLPVSSFLHLYRNLKATTKCAIEYEVLSGKNKSKELLSFAEKINADILLVHPQSETKTGWLNSHISDVLPPKSKVQILAVPAVD
jgi:nucleotide-binding universal stress UspA family protein